AAVEDDDLARRREKRQVALDVHLRLLAVRGRGQGGDAEHAGAAALGDRPDGAALAGGVPALEDDDDPLPRRLDPVLDQAKLRLQAAHPLFVVLARELVAVLAALVLAARILAGRFAALAGTVLLHRPSPSVLCDAPIAGAAPDPAAYQLRKNPTSPSLPSG